MNRSRIDGFGYYWNYDYNDYNDYMIICAKYNKNIDEIVPYNTKDFNNFISKYNVIERRPKKCMRSLGVYESS